MQIIHIWSAIVGLVAAAMFVVFGIVSQTRIADLGWRGRLRVWVFPYIAKAKDFTPAGWRLRKLYWLCFGIGALAALTFVLTA